MPALCFFGRKWQSAADDLPIPSALAAIYHSCWTVTLAGLAWSLYDALSCLNKYGSWCFVLALLFLFASLAALHITLSIVSARGTLLQTHKRRAVPVLLSVLLVFYFLTLFTNLGATVYSYVYLPSLAPDQAACLESVGLNVRNVLAMRAAVLICTWILLFSVAVGTAITYRVASTLDRCVVVGGLLSCLTSPSVQPGDKYAEPEDADEEVEEGWAAYAGVSSRSHITSMGQLFKIFMANSMDYVISDYAASLVLVSYRQMFDRQRKQSLLPPPASAAAAASPAPAAPPAPQASAAAPQTVPGSFKQLPAGAAGGGGDGQVSLDMFFIDPLSLDDAPQGSARYSAASSRALEAMEGADAQYEDVALDFRSLSYKDPAVRKALEAPEGDVPRELLEDAAYYVRYAIAVYGFPRKCGSACCGARRTKRRKQQQQQQEVAGDGPAPLPPPPAPAVPPHRLIDFEAVQDYLEDKTGAALIHATFDEQGIEGACPHLVAVDPAKKAVVLAVRGSVSANDWITDMMVEAVKLGPSWLGPFAGREASGSGRPHRADSNVSDGEKAEVEAPPIYAHRGFYHSARSIMRDLKRLNILDALLLGGQSPLGQLPDCRGWTLVVVGHSLGAGVATMLALHFRAMYPSVRGLNFAPPGPSLSPEGVATLEDTVVSFITGDDVVPRMSLPCMERLKGDMFYAATMTKMSKTALWLNGTLLRRTLTPDALFHPGEPQPSASMRRLLFQARFVSFGDASVAPSFKGLYMKSLSFLPAGRLVYCERLEHPRNYTSAALEHSYRVRWLGVEDLLDQGIVVSRWMVSDHKADFQEQVFNKLLKEEKVQPRKPEAAAAAAVAVPAAAGLSQPHGDAEGGRSGAVEVYL